MQFTAPAGARLHKGHDVDYETITVLYRGSTLQYGGGPHWSNGLPVPDVLERMVLVRERDIRAPWGNLAEYRGIRANGGHWRFVGMFTQTIEYDEADAIAARYFDAIIGSMCFMSGG